MGNDGACVVKFLDFGQALQPDDVTAVVAKVRKKQMFANQDAMDERQREVRSITSSMTSMAHDSTTMVTLVVVSTSSTYR